MPNKPFTKTTLNADESAQVAEVVMNYLATNRSINNRTLRSITSIGYDQAIYFFRIMTKEKKLMKIGTGSGTKYVLTKM